MIPANLISAFLNHLWQSTLFAVAAGLLTLVFRKNHARIRYWFWLVASLKFLVPFAVLVSVGSKLQLSSPTRALPLLGFSITIREISRPFTVPIAPLLNQPVSVPTDPNIVQFLLFAVWAIGFGITSLRWFVRWRRVRAAVQNASPLAGHSDIAVLSSSTLLEPGVFGIANPVLILPEGIVDRLTPPEMNAILAHELCHIRRSDNLAAAVHMLVEAIFWFHPLVWWIGAHLVEERERACDEEVLHLGSEPQIYAEGILKTCRFYLESPVICVSGITGADLKKRIVRIMTQQVIRKLGAGRKLLLASAGMAALVGPIAFGLMNASPSRAQRAAPSPRPEFEVASIKPSKSGGPGPMVLMQPGGRFNATNISLKALIHFAYGVQDFQIAAGPSWLNSERYDVEAKAAGPSVIEMRNLSEDQRELNLENRKLMLQALLADRFQLAVHTESKEAPIYALVVAKNGPKLKEATAEELAPSDPRDIPKPDSPESKGKFRGRGIRAGRGEFTGQAMKLSMLAEVLSGPLGRTVLDKTGLRGDYDFTLQWTPDENQSPIFRGPGDASPSTDSNGPSIFTAIQEQLGLKLESQKGPVEILVIDRAEKASEN